MSRVSSPLPLLLLLAALFGVPSAGCGARTSLDEGLDAAAPPPTDGGALPGRDAGPPPPPLDAGPPPGCAWGLLGEPITVMEDRGIFHAPAVVERAGGLDLVATSVSLTDRVTLAMARRARLRGSTLFLEGSSTLGRVGEAPSPRYASDGARLLACVHPSPRRFDLLAFGGESYSPSPPLLEDNTNRCLAVDASMGRIFVAGEAEHLAGYGFVEGGGLEIWGIFDPGFGEGGTMAATGGAADGGYAIALAREGARAIEVHWIGPGGEIFRMPAFLDGWVFEGGASPAIASAFGHGRPSVFVAGYTRGGRFAVSEISPEVGEIARHELSFSMHMDITPALAALPGGLVIANQSFGDADPTGGVLEIYFLRDYERLEGPITLEARRSGELRWGGISAAAVGERAVIHYTHTEDDESLYTETRALIVGCEG